MSRAGHSNFELRMGEEEARHRSTVLDYTIDQFRGRPTITIMGRLRSWENTASDRKHQRIQRFWKEGGPGEISVDVTVLLMNDAFIFIAYLPRRTYICTYIFYLSASGACHQSIETHRRNMRIEKDGIHFHSLLEIKLPPWSMEIRIPVCSDGAESHSHCLFIQYFSIFLFPENLENLIK